jgi:hypothetical protein
MREKEAHSTREYLSLLGFILLWFGLYLFLLVVIFMKHVGFNLVLLTVAVLWAILVLIFALIFLINIFSMLYSKIHDPFRISRVRKRMPGDTARGKTPGDKKGNSEFFIRPV